MTNYTLEIDGPWSNNITAVTSTGNEISAGNLQENVIYTFKVRVLNDIGSVATKETVICKYIVLWYICMLVQRNLFIQDNLHYD